MHTEFFLQGSHDRPAILFYGVPLPEPARLGMERCDRLAPTAESRWAKEIKLRYADYAH